jgi:hypothetical protein
VVQYIEVICPKFNILFASPWCFSAVKQGIENDIGVSVTCGGRSDGGEAGDCRVSRNGDEDGDDGVCYTCRWRLDGRGDSGVDGERYGEGKRKY